MKTVINTPQELRLESRPWLLGALLAAGMLVFLGVGMTLIATGEVLGGALLILGGLVVDGLVLWALVRLEEVVFSRQTGEVVRQVRTITGKTTRQEWPLDQVRRAEVRTRQSRSSKGHTSTVRRAELALADGSTVPLTGAFTSGRGPIRAAEAINAWLGAAHADHRG